MTPFDDQTKLLASDVDNNDIVDVRDLIELRKLVLTINEKLPNNTSYKFIPTASINSYKFGDRPPFKLNISKSGNMYDFKGIKIGNVN